MAKKTKAQPRRKSNKRNRWQWRQVLLPARTTITKGWKTILFVLGLLATLSGVLSLLPRISVTPTTWLNDSDLFWTPFTISNDGIITIHSVSFRCHIRNVEDESHAKVVAYERGISPDGFLIPELSPGEKATVACPFPFKFDNPIIGADFDFVVVYRPDWIPWQQEKRFRFGTAKNDDGKLIWLPRSISE